MPATDTLSLTERIRRLAEEVIAGTGYFLVDVEVRGHKGTRVVEVYVDASTDLGLDDLAVVSRELGFLLDVEDVVDGSYKLEVSTPGIKRPITMPQQFVKNVGRTLRVRYQLEEDDDERIVVADLLEADDDGITLELPDGHSERVPYDAMNQARIELPW
jgi:ribosome maturation factor RimP